MTNARRRPTGRDLEKGYTKVTELTDSCQCRISV